MRRSMRVVLTCTLYTLGIAATAAAQTSTPRVVFGLSGGVQAGAATLKDHLMFERNVETATADIEYPVKAAVLFDGGLSVRLVKRLGAGVNVSRATGENDADVEASIPHPFRFEQPRSISGTQGHITRAETGVHAQLQYWLGGESPVSVMLYGGPSWLNIEQELVTGVEYDETFPFDTATFRSAVTRRSKASAVGFNAGVDVRWMFSGSMGLGGMVRFTRGTVDLVTEDNRTLTVHPGGVQAGVGLRAAF
jgi:hypothetical protein